MGKKMGKKARKNKAKVEKQDLSTPVETDHETEGFDFIQEVSNCTFMKVSKDGDFEKEIWKDGKIVNKKNKKKKNAKNNKTKINEQEVIQEKLDNDKEKVAMTEPNPSKAKPKKKRKKNLAEDDVQCKKARLDDTSPQKQNQEATGKADVCLWDKTFVPPPVLEAISELGFTSPTEIQRLVLPAAIKGRMDIIGAAETGSGKTLAFGIPIIHGILVDREREAKKKKLEEDSGFENSENEGEVPNDGDKEGLDIDDDDEKELLEDEEEEDEMLEGEDEEDEMLEGEDEEDEDDALFDNDDISDDDISDMKVMESDDPFGDAEVVGCAFPSSDEEFEDNEDEDVDEDLFMDIGDDEQEGMKSENNIGCVKVIEDIEFDFFNKKKSKSSLKPLRALIVTPTRELAMQVRSHLMAVLVHTDIKVALVIGGLSSAKQTRVLSKGPEIVVGTPGRLWELITNGNEHLNQVRKIKYLAIDETDRMIEQGHFEELTMLLDMINKDEEAKKRRQNFVFSATLTMVHSAPRRLKMKKKTSSMTTEMKVKQLTKLIGLKDKPKVVDVTRKFGTAETLTESKINCDKDEKDVYLYYFLKMYPGRTLVFCNSIDCVRRMQNLFTILLCQPQSLHASMHQKQRLKSLERFSSSSQSLLLATDVAARGLDIPNITHVIHYQTPRTAETYIHRSGRTARATQEGLSVLFVDQSELSKYRQLCTTLNRQSDLPSFPIDLHTLDQVKKKVSLARDLESMEHIQRKHRANENWYKKAAREAELIDEDDEDDSEDEDVARERQKRESNEKYEMKAMKDNLRRLLVAPLFSPYFSSRYPTQSGGLIDPLDKESKTENGNNDANEDALLAMKKESAAYTKLAKKYQPKITNWQKKKSEKKKLKASSKKERRAKKKFLTAKAMGNI